MIYLALLDPEVLKNDKAATVKKIFESEMPGKFEHARKLDVLEGLDFEEDKPPFLENLVGKNLWRK